MQTPEPGDKVRDALHLARQEMNGIERVTLQLRRRLDAARIHSVLFTPARLSAVAAAAMIVIGWQMVRHDRRPTPPPPSYAVENVRDASLTFDGADLTEHAAVLLDSRRVLIIWSLRDGHASISTAASRIGKYRCRVLRQSTTADGRKLTCQLFIADPGVQVLVDPPSIVARVDSNTFVAFSVSPTSVTKDQLAQVLNSPAVDLRVEDLTLANATP